MYLGALAGKAHHCGQAGRVQDAEDPGAGMAALRQHPCREVSPGRGGAQSRAQWQNYGSRAGSQAALRRGLMTVLRGVGPS